MSCAPLPTAAQVHATRQLIANRIREIESAEEQIRQHEAHIAGLRSKIDKTYEAIAADEAYIAPVRRIPFEILGDIITLRTTDRLAPVQVVRDLGSVCKFWRHTTLSTPKAWTRVPVYVPFRSYDEDRDGPRKSLQTLRDVQEWYDRSGSCKKAVWLDADFGTEDVFAILEWVLSRPELLRSFGTGLSPKDGWDKHLSRPMPALQALRIPDHSLNQGILSALAHSSPRFSCLKFRQLPSVNLLAPVQTRLKTLFVSEVSSKSFFRMLRAGQGFVELQTLKVSVPIDHLARPKPSLAKMIIPLPNLRDLSLQVDDITIPFLAVLQMPQLKSLAVSRTHASLHTVTKKQGAEFLQIGANDDLALRELRLCDFWLSDADLLKLLKRTPRLELLAVVNGKTSDKVMDALSATQPGKSARWLCPNLSRLCIISDSSAKSDKFRVSQDGTGALVTARLRANLSSPRRGAGPPVARLMNVRLDHYDVVFTSILNADWVWKLDEKELSRFNSIDLEHVRSGDIMWWHYQAQWNEVY